MTTIINPTTIELELISTGTPAQQLDRLDSLAAWLWAAGADDVQVGEMSARAVISDPSAVEPLLRALERDERVIDHRTF